MAPVILNGAAAVGAARAIKAQHDKADAWPYEWMMRPPGSRNVFVSAFVASPATATQVVVLTYKVPDSMSFVLTRLVFQLSGTAAATYSPGDFTFVLDVNQPIGSLSAQGVSFTSFGNVQITLGTLEIPWPVMTGEGDVLKANDEVRIKVTNNSFPVGLPNFFVGIILGYTMPRRMNA